MGIKIKFCSVQSELSRGISVGPGHTLQVASICVSVTKNKKQLSLNTNSFWMIYVSNHAYGSSSEASCTTVKAEAHKVHKLRTSLQEELRSPADPEGWYVALSVNNYSLLLEKCLLVF